MGRMMQGLICMNFPLTALLQAAVSAYDFWTFTKLSSPDGYLGAMPHSGHLLYHHNFLLRQISVCVMVACPVWAIQHAYAAEAQALKAVRQSQDAYAKVSRILCGICDAVLELDDSLCVAGGPHNGMAKFAALLLRQRDVNGATF